MRRMLRIADHFDSCKADKIWKVSYHDMIIVPGRQKVIVLYGLLMSFYRKQKKIAYKVYIIEDATSLVVIPGVFDFTEQSDKAFKNFSDAGRNIVTTKSLNLFKAAKNYR